MNEIDTFGQPTQVLSAKQMNIKEGLKDQMSLFSIMNYNYDDKQAVNAKMAQQMSKL